MLSETAYRLKGVNVTLGTTLSLGFLAPGKRIAVWSSGYMPVIANPVAILEACSYRLYPCFRK